MVKIGIMFRVGENNLKGWGGGKSLYISDQVIGNDIYIFTPLSETTKKVVFNKQNIWGKSAF